MTDVLTSLLSYILLYKYVALGCLVFLNAIIIPIPINTLLLAAGAFASQGYLRFDVALAVAVISNVIGDSVDYGLARRWGPRVFTILHLRTNRWVQKVEHYISTHAGLTIFLTRFIGVLGPVGSVFAGLVKVPLWKFLAADAAGNFTEIASVMALGYVVGVYWQSFSSVLSLGGWIIFVAACLVGFILYFFKRWRYH